MSALRRIYLASSWRNLYQPNAVDLLRQHGHQVYDFRNPSQGWDSPVPDVLKGFAWSDLDPEWQGWDNQRYRSLLLNHPVAERGFQSDWQAMEWADTGVLLLPSGRSAHIEAGYFVGAGKELHILLLDDFGSSVQIPLTQGYEATVDERDGELAQFSWHAHPSKHTYYAARSVGPKGTQKTVFMHRLITGAPDGIDVDHRDGNGLNNRRSNIRVATRAQNIQNTHPALGQVPFRGVFEDKGQPGRYRAAIRHLGKRTYLGSYSTPEDAARAYDEAATRMHGEFASVNFPQPRPTFTPELMYRMATAIHTNTSELVKALERAQETQP